MKDEELNTTREIQFRSKDLVRAAAADAAFETKIERLVKLQEINFELAKQTGRTAPKPWILANISNGYDKLQASS